MNYTRYDYEGLRTLWNPDGDSVAQCHKYGKQFAVATKE